MFTGSTGSVGVWVLDAPALVSYAQGSDYMMALLSSAIRQHTTFLVPASALMEAYAAPGIDVDALHEFVGHKGDGLAAVRVTPLTLDVAVLGGEAWTQWPNAPLAAVHVALLAQMAEAPVVTAPRERISNLLGEGHPILVPPVD